jgi:hypothetical protein
MTVAVLWGAKCFTASLLIAFPVRNHGRISLGYYLVRMGMGHLAKLFLPEIIYTKLKRAVRRDYSVPLD